MKLIALTLCILLMVSGNVESGDTPVDDLCSCISTNLVQPIDESTSRLWDLSRELDDFVEALRPGFAKNAIRIAMGRFKISLRLLKISVNIAAKVKRIKDVCKLTKILKIILNILHGKVVASRSALRVVERSWVRLVSGTYDPSPEKSVLDQMMAELNQLSKIVLNTELCYIDSFVELHCEHGDNLLGLGRKQKVDKTLAEAKEDLEECVCENLEDRLQNKQLRNLMELFRQLLRDLPRGRLSQTVQAAQRDINMLRPMINDALRDKPSDDLCALADWVKALLGDVQQKICDLRVHLRNIDINVRPNRVRSTIDNILDVLVHIERTLIRVGCCYMDFFLMVHCEPEKCTCIMEGDPFVKTCDSDLIFLQGQGYFQMVEVLQTGGDCHDLFEVIVWVKKVNNRPIPVGLIILTEQKTILTVTESEVKVNSTVTQLPFTIGSIEVTSSGSFKFINVRNCGSLSFRPGEVIVMLSPDLQGKTRGLCGNFDGISEIPLSADMKQISYIFARAFGDIFGD